MCFCCGLLSSNITVLHLPETSGHVPFCKPTRKSSAWPAVVPAPRWLIQEGKILTFYGWFVQGPRWKREGSQANHTPNFYHQSLVPDGRGREKEKNAAGLRSSGIIFAEKKREGLLTAQLPNFGGNCYLMVAERLPF